MDTGASHDFELCPEARVARMGVGASSPRDVAQDNGSGTKGDTVGYNKAPHSLSPPLPLCVDSVWFFNQQDASSAITSSSDSGRTQRQPELFGVGVFCVQSVLRKDGMCDTK